MDSAGTTTGETNCGQRQDKGDEDAVVLGGEGNLGVDVSVGLGVDISEMEGTLDAELPADENEMTDTLSGTSVKRVLLADAVVGCGGWNQS